MKIISKVERDKNKITALVNSSHPFYKERSTLIQCGVSDITKNKRHPAFEHDSMSG